MKNGTTERGPLRPSCTCTRGQGPWTLLGDIASWEEKTASASFNGSTESLRASGPRKPGKTPGGERAFPLGFFQAFPGCFASGMAASFRRLNRRKSAQRTLLVSPDLTADEIPATGGHRRFVRPRSHNVTKLAILPINSGRLLSRWTRQHPPMRVQGDHPPGQVWAESPAYPLCWPSVRYCC